MRKYLITGVLALAAGGFLTSCHDTEGAYSSIVEQKLQAYEQVFKEEFGEIDPNQDWGFGETSTSAARTRATPSESYQNGYSGAYPDANEWAMRGYTVPPELTEGQKLRVQYYFQTVKITDPNRPKNGNMDFFIQQVYDGATDPITQYSGYSSPTYSTEVYKAADNINYIESGKHMDHLTAGEGTDRRHIYNFNNSTYGTNGAPNRDVQNSEGVTYHSTGNAEGYHADQIQLMLNTNTDCFGYGNSDDSYVRDDRWTLVSWETIESYCNNPANGYEAWRSTNHSNIPDASLNDGWGRSFIGFDFDMLPDEYILAGDFEWDYSQNPAKITNVKSWTYFSIWLGDKDEVWNGTRLVKANTLGEVVAENGGYRFYPYMPGTTKKVNTVNANKNEYCGSSEEWTDNDWKYYDENGNDTGYKSIVKMKKALEDEKLPTSSSDKTWVTIGNCADDYYSDWIVSFLPADPNQTINNNIFVPIEPGGGTKKGSRITTYMWELTESQKGRIMCEDLGVIKASDIDFNDLVFDAYIYNAQKKKKVVTVDENNNIVSGPTITDENESTRLAEIYILAAGGTLPISVAGERVKDHFSDENRSGSLSDAFIVNTCTRDGDGDGGAYSNPWWNYNTAQKIEKFDDTQTMTLKDIKVIVQYGSKILELYSERGLAPHKICVPLDLASGVNVKWPLERVVIKEAYEDFTKYVKDEDETIVFTPDANSESDAPDSDGTNPNGVSYFNREQSNTCWTRTEKINPDKLFNETVNYTPRNLNSDADTNGKYYIISTSSEEVDIPDTSKGYQQGETILVRRRH